MPVFEKSRKSKAQALPRAATPRRRCPAPRLCAGVGVTSADYARGTLSLSSSASETFRGDFYARRRRGLRRRDLDPAFGLLFRILWVGAGSTVFTAGATAAGGADLGTVGLATVGLGTAGCRRGRSGFSSDSSWRGTSRRRRTRARRL